jgi:glycosyltransferase involved in cell wall biosynthesis
MIETVENPRFRYRDLTAAGKRPGISAVMRLHNEEDFVADGLTSILPFFDEIVVVYNTCTDRTPEIVADFAARYPDQIRAFHYVPEVFPQGSPQHSRLPANSVHSLVHYTNFAFSKATCRILCAWDGDEIAIPQGVERVTQQIRSVRPGTLEWLLSPWQLGYWYYSGVNLWDQDGMIQVPLSRPEVGRGREHGIWSTHRCRAFRRYGKGEYLFKRFLRHRWVGYLHYHVKGMKRDRGVGVFQFERFPDSLDKQRIEKKWTNPALQPFAEWRAAHRHANTLPDPESLGIRPRTQR